MSPKNAHFFYIKKSQDLELRLEEREEIQILANQVIDDDQLFLVDIELKGSKENRIIWIFVESKDGHITLDQCANISRELQLLLDASGWYNRKYTLNVSSPGLDRPLKDIRQYVNNLGRKAVVVYKKNGTETRLEGEIKDVGQDTFTVVKDDNQRHDIPFSDVLETRILVSFK